MPEIEFTKIKSDVMADTFLKDAHLKKSIMGLNKIPPPIPTNPDKKPIIAPVNKPAAKGIRFVSSSDFFKPTKKVIAVINKQIPNIRRYIAASTTIEAPKNDIGIDRIISGMKSLILK